MTFSHAVNKHGFTLIELIIAIGLGTMVAYIALAGVRTAAQSISISQRMSMENNIIRSGISIALSETDFWLSYDNPWDFGNKEHGQLLREEQFRNGQYQGLPFMPFKHSHVYKQTQLPNQAGQMNAGEKETATGWDPNAWGAHESRGWSWGNLIERVPVHLVTIKDNGITRKRKVPNGWAANYQNTLNNSNIGLVSRQYFGAYYNVASTDTTDPPPHPWQQRQLYGLKRSLGIFGLFSYLPANVPLMIYSKENKQKMWGVSPEWVWDQGGNGVMGDHVEFGTNGTNFAQDMLHAALKQAYVMPNPMLAHTNLALEEKPRNTLELTTIINTRFVVGEQHNANMGADTVESVDRLLRNADSGKSWLNHARRTAPEHWPSLRVSSIRKIGLGALACLNRITWVSPMTGKETEFTFTAFGSNLRGARQQRLRDEAGWCDPFPLSGAPKPHLDTY